MVLCIRLVPFLGRPADEIWRMGLEWVYAAQAVYLADVARANERHSE